MTFTATNSGQGGRESDGNEEVMHVPPKSRSGALPSDVVYCHTQDSHWVGGGVLILCSDVVGVFVSPSQLGKTMINDDIQCNNMGYSCYNLYFGTCVIIDL